MYIISMKEVILMIYIILTIIAVLLSTLIMGVANKYTNKKIHDIDHELNRVFNFCGGQTFALNIWGSWKQHL